MVIGLFIVISCTSNEQTINIFDCDNEPVDSVLQNEEWYSYIDSISAVSFNGEVEFLDSVTTYFMMPNAPNVLSKPKYIFWSKGSKITFGDFDFFERVSDSLFVVVSRGKRSINITEFSIGDSKLKEKNSIIFDMNKNAFKEPCFEICDLISNIQNKNINISIQIFNSCSEEYSIRNILLKY